MSVRHKGLQHAFSSELAQISTGVRLQQLAANLGTDNRKCRAGVGTTGAMVRPLSWATVKGRSRLSIGRMVNPKICVASDPTLGGTIRSTQAKSACTTMRAPQVPLAIALGKSVGWAN